MAEVLVSKNVFTLYAGLTASGYDLAAFPEDDPVAKIVDSLREMPLSSPAHSYFPQARLPGPGVNPYWPRAAMLLHATFFLDDDATEYTDLRALRKMVEDFPASDGPGNEESLAWLMGYPSAFRAVRESAHFLGNWSDYVEAMNPERLLGFRDAALRATGALRFFGGSDLVNLPKIVLVPNPLQAQQIADFVDFQGILYVVTAAPSASSIVHECMHGILVPILEADQILRAKDLFDASLVESMVRMQYARDDGPLSWLRVFEESLVRAATSWALCRGDLDNASCMAASDLRQGFTLVPPMLSCFDKYWAGQDRSAAFLGDCLGALSAALD